MRKIDKSKILSTVYKKWEEELEESQKSHPKYNSTNGKYYLDIAMNLYHCQQGLCAYTEMFLCDPADCSPEHWKDGRYKGIYKKKKSSYQGN